MSHPQDIIRLFSSILFQDVRRHSVSDDDMKAAISDMQQVYKPDSRRLSSSVRRLADYNSMAYRCAYLHKYAPFHTAMVHDIFKGILLQNDHIFRVFQKRFTNRQKLKICSLGGGPGSDIVGVLVALFEEFGFIPCSAKVIDIKSDWKDTLNSVIIELRSGMYGSVGEGFKHQYFNWSYLTADLLEEMHDDVKFAIGSAELVTMVKFVSAVACDSTELMLKKIFTMLKLGAVVLFVDNSSGGYRQVVAKAAKDCNLSSVCGPINYQVYTNEAFKITHWGYTSCYSTTVTVHMMQKLRHSPPLINIPSKKVVYSTSKSNNKLSSINNNNKPIKHSELQAENVTLQAKLKEIQGNNLKDRNEFTAEIAELQKTISANKDQIKILKETIQILEKYKADVKDYEVQIVSAKEQIVNLKKELEKAKTLQEQSALSERQIQVNEMDLETTEQVTARKEDIVLIQQLQHDKKLLNAEISQLKMNLQQAEIKLKEKQENVNEKGKRKRPLSNANKDTVIIKEHEDENEVSPKRQRVLRSNQHMVAEPVSALVQEQKNMASVKNAMHFVESKIASFAQSVSSMPNSRVTRSSRNLFNVVSRPTKTEPKQAQSVSSIPNSRITRSSRRLFNVGARPKKIETKQAQSVSSMSNPQITRSQKTF